MARKSKEDNKTDTILFRLSKEEKESIENSSKKLGISTAQFIRDACKKRCDLVKQMR